MTHLKILVEGYSEEHFVKCKLAPFLLKYNVKIEELVNMNGANWTDLQKHLKIMSSNDKTAWITTIIDVYPLSKKYPSYKTLKNISNPTALVEAMEAMLSEFMCVQQHHEQFIPFFVLHEFEAWLFSQPEIIVEHFQNKQAVRKEINKILNKARNNPEDINHGEATHPKAHLLRITQDNYKSGDDGIKIINKIDINIIKESCQHFANWLDRLIKLGKNNNAI